MQILGFGPSFTEITYNPEYAPIFERHLQAFLMTGSHFASKGKEESEATKYVLKGVFRGYKSTFDNPACFFVPEIIELFPHARAKRAGERWGVV